MSFTEYDALLSEVRMEVATTDPFHLFGRTIKTPSWIPGSITCYFRYIIVQITHGQETEEYPQIGLLYFLVPLRYQGGDEPLHSQGTHGKRLGIDSKGRGEADPEAGRHGDEVVAVGVTGDQEPEADDAYFERAYCIPD